MSVPMAYLGVVLIWTTTPLAVKWSAEGSDYLFAITSRTWLAAILCLMLVALLRHPLPWHRQALKVYMVSAVGLFGSMISVYWASQFVTSGLIAVIFGLSPLMTGVLSAWLLRDGSLTASRIVAKLFGVAGLAIIFLQGISTGEHVVAGISMLLFGTLLHSVVLVTLKRIPLDASALSINTGGMLLALVPYSLCWVLLRGELPEHITNTAIYAIVYLGVIGSVLAFVLMFYILKRTSATAVALIALITPVLALLMGSWLNNEIIEPRTMFGTLMILGGLLIYQWPALRVYRSKFKRVVGRSPI